MSRFGLCGIMMAHLGQRDALLAGGATIGPAPPDYRVALWPKPNAAVISPANYRLFVSTIATVSVATTTAACPGCRAAT